MATEKPSYTRNTLIFLTLAIILVVAGATYWRYETRYPHTEDAYVHAHTLYITSQVSGPVADIAISNNQPVKQSAVLFRIDPTPFQIAVRKAQAAFDLAQQSVEVTGTAVSTAQAQLDKAQAELTQARKQAARILPLVHTGRMSGSAGDNAKKQREVAEAAVFAAKSGLKQAKQKSGLSGNRNAQLRQAKAALDAAKLNLMHTTITAPADGYIVNLTLRPGAMVTAAQPLFVLVEKGKWWVSANFSETQLARIKPEQRATITLDLYPDHPFKGTVQSLSRGSQSAFSLFPAENTAGNWIKVTQRFSVKVLVDDPDPNYPLRVGASCQVRIDTQS